jgi:hypothetical protein
MPRQSVNANTTNLASGIATGPTSSPLLHPTGGAKNPPPCPQLGSTHQPRGSSAPRRLSKLLTKTASPQPPLRCRGGTTTAAAVPATGRRVRVEPGRLPRDRLGVGVPPVKRMDWICCSMQEDGRRAGGSPSKDFSVRSSLHSSLIGFLLEGGGLFRCTKPMRYAAMSRYSWLSPTIYIPASCESVEALGCVSLSSVHPIVKMYVT